MTDVLMVEKCWACIVGLHDECYAPELVTEPVVDEITAEHLRCCCAKSKDADAAAFVNDPGRPVLDPSDIGDVKSTGRKRAAMLYPIFDGQLCEWSGLAFAGGGVVPIVGCDGNTISPTKEGPHAGHRHHGPDKNTINNGPLNVHRICTSCHTYWHAQNNRYYEGERPAADQPWMPVAPEGMQVFKHDPDTLATPEEIEEAHSGRKNMRADVDTDD